MIVVKFGGTSLADPGQIRKAAEIIRANPSRRCVVVSAPGKRDAKDEKITDLLISCHRLGSRGLDFSAPFQLLCDRFREIIRELGLELSLEEEFQELKEALKKGAGQDYAASRGEYFNGRIMAALLGFSFLDPKCLVRFDADGELLMDETLQALSQALRKSPRAVIPGFYGAGPAGKARTFSRGGSDITGSLAAAAAGAELYENWTDVSGLLMADPRVVHDPKPIPQVTYRELRELSYMGASVMHEDAIFPVRERGIPINIKNTNAPEDPGTLIVAQAPSLPGTITGIAGKKGFSALFVEKDRMNAIVGFGRRVLSVLEEEGISFEHLPSGIDTLSVLVETQALQGRENKVISLMQNAVHPDRIHLEKNLCLIAVVGRGMINSPGSASRLFSALAREDVNIRMIDQGSSELNIIVGLDEKDYERGLRAIYREFVPTDLI